MRAPRTLVALSLLAVVGCGYSVRPPYRSDVRTVYVPVFKSVSFRRDLNLQLTYKVQEEIKRRTPFKVVGSPDGADTTLDGTVSFVDKNAAVESPNNLPRQIMATVVSNVSWTDNRQPEKSKTRKFTSPITENASFYPEIGETAGLGFSKALDQMAREIVDMMEEPW